MNPTAFDHVALWVSERERIAAFLCGHLGMHEIERTDTFTLAGTDAKLGKITLFDAEGPRERGALGRIVLRVSDLAAALRRLPPDVDVVQEGALAAFDGPEGLPLGLVEADGAEYDLDHVVLSVPDPDSAAENFEQLGFERRSGALAVADRSLRLEPGEPDATERPLLNHLALLVDSASTAEAAARARGIGVAEIKDAANTLAVFVWGPDSVKVEYVEHKPGFSLV